MLASHSIRPTTVWEEKSGYFFSTLRGEGLLSPVVRIEIKCRVYIFISFEWQEIPATLIFGHCYFKGLRMFYFLPATLTHHMKVLLCLLLLMTFCIGTGYAQVRKMEYAQILKYDSTYYVSYESDAHQPVLFLKKIYVAKIQRFR